MFGFGLFTYIKIALAVVVLGVLGFFVWNYHHRGAVIEQQKIQIANLELEKDVLVKKGRAEAEFAARKTTVRRQVAQNEKVIDDTLASGDIERIIHLWDPYRLRDHQIYPPPVGGTGSPPINP